MVPPHLRINSTNNTSFNLPVQPILATLPCKLAASWAETTTRSPHWFHSRVGCWGGEQEAFSHRQVQKHQNFSAQAQSQLQLQFRLCILSAHLQYCWLHDTASGSELTSHLGAGEGELTSVSAQWGSGICNTHPRSGAGDGTAYRCHTSLMKWHLERREGPKPPLILLIELRNKQKTSHNQVSRKVRKGLSNAGWIQAVRAHFSRGMQMTQTLPPRLTGCCVQDVLFFSFPVFSSLWASVFVLFLFSFSLSKPQLSPT